MIKTRIEKKTTRSLAVCILLGLTGTMMMSACSQEEQQRVSPLVQAPVQGDVLHRYYEPMIQNAAISDMSISDGHFVPHTSALSDLGARRLDRLVMVLEEHGGTVRLQSRVTDEKMLEARIKAVETYLADTGLVMTDVKVERMVPGGQGLSAYQAMDARTKAIYGERTKGEEEAPSKPK